MRVEESAKADTREKAIVVESGFGTDRLGRRCQEKLRFSIAISTSKASTGTQTSGNGYISCSDYRDLLGLKNGQAL